MVCHSLLQWTASCQISPPWPICFEWPHMAWPRFIELDKAVVLVWSNWLVFCEYGFSVSALWCPLTTPTFLHGFLLPWTWGISSWLLQQSAAAAPYLGRGVSPHGRPSWPWTWSSSSWPSCADSLDIDSVQFSSVHSVVSDSLRPHESQHIRPPCPSPTPRVYSDSCPSNWWCHPVISCNIDE